MPGRLRWRLAMSMRQSAFSAAPIRSRPATPGSKLGLARALVRNGNPFDAFPLFEEAERGGAIDSAAALDRGLAYDLVADNAAAQRYYRQALAAGPNDEAVRRLAISLAIAGDKRGSGTTLSPLLSLQDKAAWRARAFSLAILGQADEAISVVNGTLPANLAGAIAPYLRYMPRLTPAQQAAAANFGQFPRASEIGQDDPRIARYATNSSRRIAVASADSGLIPKGEPLGRNGRGRDSRESNRTRSSDSARQRVPAVAAADAFPPFNRNDTRNPPVVAQPVRTAAPVAVARAEVQPPRPVATPAPPPSPPPPVVAPPPVRVAPTIAATPVAQPAPTPRPVIAAAPPPPPPPIPAPAPAPVVGPVAEPAPPVIAAASIPALVAAPPSQPVAAPPPPPPPPPPPRIAPSTAAPPVPPTPRRMTLAEAFSDLGGPGSRRHAFIGCGRYQADQPYPCSRSWHADRDSSARAAQPPQPHLGATGDRARPLGAGL